MRGIARAAGVDPGSVRHHFGDKSNLFAAAVELPANPEAFLSEVASIPAPQLGEALATAFFSLWDTPQGHQRLRAIVTTAPTDPPTMRALAEFIAHSVLGTVAAKLGTDDAAERATLAGTQLIGVMIGRALIGVDPLASMPRDRLIAWLAPELTLLLTGPAPPGPAPTGPAAAGPAGTGPTCPGTGPPSSPAPAAGEGEGSICPAAEPASTGPTCPAPVPPSSPADDR
jgi:AcrR family transcriptional regulator